MSDLYISDRDRGILEALLHNWARWGRTEAPRSVSNLYPIIQRLRLYWGAADEEQGGLSAPSVPIDEKSALLVDNALCRIAPKNEAEHRAKFLLTFWYLRPSVPVGIVRKMVKARGREVYALLELGRALALVEMKKVNSSWFDT